ncbi:complement component C8 gamma chain isoform X5 [Odocoileus virginianus]|uniref:Complement component C8 gamma chain isoform X5 n=1 Tax=Odocoileus virginianus TaxID=9874 RepID=A0A6J0X2C8_ODOVR|nr:complement component C8 gamma chain isoform X4 [Odocoileus virginianus texanus]
MNVQRGDLPDPGFEPGSPALQVDSATRWTRTRGQLGLWTRTRRRAPAGKHRAEVRCPGSQGPGSWWPWPPRVATCRSRAIGPRPPLCTWLLRARPWPSAPSESSRGARGPVNVVIGDTDYRGFAVLYLERARQLSVKLYVRSLPVSDSFLSAFEQRVQGANLTEDHILFFPKYGFCETADQFHTLDELRR